jgi:site-specific DNA-methyltransferase (adenine-specific)
MTSDEGDIILDPFMGTGTTAIAAKRLGRNYIGFELDENYVKAAQNKLEKVNLLSQIENIWISFFIGEVISIRDIDWDNLSKYYIIPSPISKIDHTKICLRDKECVCQCAERAEEVNDENSFWPFKND